MKRNVIIFILGICYSLICYSESKKPNFLVIVADDLGYSDLGCYGSEISTPNLDRLASDGLRYTDFYNTARCWTSRSSLMCGYYATQINSETNKNSGYPSWIRSIPQMLKGLGYRSYHSGKWHILPFNRAVADAGFDRSYKLEDHSFLFTPKKHFLNDIKLPAVQSGDKYEYTTKGTVDYLIKFLEEHKEKYSNQPFFAYLAFIVPHFPLQAPQEDIAKYRGKYNDGWDVLRKERLEKMKGLGFPENWSLSKTERRIVAPSGKIEKNKKILGDGEIYTAREWNTLSDAEKSFQAKKMEIHAGMISRMDKDIGRVFETLKEMGELDNTVIMFFSDNGASAEILVRGGGHDSGAKFGSQESFLCLGPGWANMCNTPFRRYKIWTHEGGISTPFIVHWGDKIKDKGKLKRDPLHLIDIMPTLISLAGGEVPDKVSEKAPHLEGKDFSETFNSDKRLDREYIFFYHEKNRGLRMGDWKIVSSKNDDNVWEMYNLGDDRMEQNDLSKKYPEKFKEMVLKWESLNSKYKAEGESK